MTRNPPPNGVVIASGEDGFAWQHGRLRVIASWGGGWDHVSVSLPDRCPTWDEMSFVARTFFPNEYAMQLHVPESDHRNFHPFCLHLWRPQNVEIPHPPGWMVAPKANEIAVMT